MFKKLFTVFFICNVVFSLENDTLSQKPPDVWDETEQFAQNGPPSPDLRLPSDIVPSFYRLKLKADLVSWNYSGEVYITLRADKKIKEIILHSKNLTIKNNAKLTEQLYEKVETLHMRSKRDVTELNVNNVTLVENKPTVVNTSNVIAKENVVVPNTQTTSVPTVLLEAADQSNSVKVDITVQNKSTNNIVDAVENTTVKAVETTTSKDPVDAHTSQVTLSSVRDIKILSITQASGDRLILTLDTSLKPNVDYILELPFEGQISNSLSGFYKSTYTNEKKEEKSLAATQFEPTSARAAFPCFDEPGFKAKFEISIAHHTNTTVLSNMKVAATEVIKEQPDWEWTHFERSVRMSPYLVAYILCDFKSLETSYTSKDNVTKPIRIWTRPELLKKATYAASITPKLLEFYEEVFGLPYVLDKLDLIAIPDFANGAMENWGLMTFRETGLLFDEETGVARDKQNVAISIAHELAHQWFGNLVTMQWWTDLWLNEGFATYIEYVGVDHIEPAWNMFEDFTRDMLELLRSDALKNTSPVSRRVVDASEIQQKFDEISYIKGATLIRMLNNTITEEIFRKGLVKYLNRWKYSNAEENDLWDSMSAAVPADPVLAGRSLRLFMNSWTRQAGYPVVNVHRDYNTGNVHFEQKLFTSSKNPYKAMEEQLWQIPINYVAVDAPASEWVTKPKLWLSERSTDVALSINSSQALYVNIGATGYYRVNYDQRNWELLSTAIKSNGLKSAVTKAQLINDAFNLAKSDQLSYGYALALATCVRGGEDSKMLWDMVLAEMGFLNYNLKTNAGYSYFQDFVKILIRKQLEKLNYGLSKPKDDNEALLAENLVMWECMVESPRCLDWARDQFAQWMKSPNITDNPIPVNLRSLVYNMAVKYGGRREFEFLWRVFERATDPSVKALAIASLPATRDEALITMLLEKSLSAIPKHYAQAAWNVEPPVGSQCARRLLLRDFPRVRRAAAAIDATLLPAVLSAAFGFITTIEELDTLKSFAVAHKEELKPMSHTLQKLMDAARLRIDWVQTHSQEIVDWLKNYVTDAANSTVSNRTTAETGDKSLPAVRSNQQDTNSLKDQPKVPSEQLKIPQEQPKVSQEQSNVQLEQQKVPQEQSKLQLEQQKVPQEQSKVQLEQQKVPQEQSNVQLEQQKVPQEQSKVQLEQQKVPQEQSNVQLEQQKVPQEQSKVQLEQSNVQLEQQKVSQEQSKVQQEQSNVPLQNKATVAP